MHGLATGRVLRDSTGTPSRTDGAAEPKPLLLQNVDPQTPLGWKPYGQSAFTKLTDYGSRD